MPLRSGHLCLPEFSSSFLRLQLRIKSTPLPSRIAAGKDDERFQPRHKLLTPSSRHAAPEELSSLQLHSLNSMG